MKAPLEFSRSAVGNIHFNAGDEESFCSKRTTRLLYIPSKTCKTLCDFVGSVHIPFIRPFTGIERNAIVLYFLWSRQWKQANVSAEPRCYRQIEALGNDAETRTMLCYQSTLGTYSILLRSARKTRRQAHMLVSLQFHIYKRRAAWFLSFCDCKKYWFLVSQIEGSVEFS